MLYRLTSEIKDPKLITNQTRSLWNPKCIGNKSSISSIWIKTQSLKTQISKSRQIHCFRFRVKMMKNSTKPLSLALQMNMRILNLVMILKILKRINMKLMTCMFPSKEKTKQIINLYFQAETHSDLITVLQSQVILILET